MKLIQPSFSILLRVVTCATVALSVVAQLQAADKKSDAAGTWTWTTPGRNGGADRKSTLKLKADGDKVTGKISSPGRDGQATEVDIEDGKIKGDEISFSVTREFGGNKVTQKYTGKIDGDSIKGKIAFERNGEAQSRDWEAKRGSDKKE
jgi:hypothetical protein